MDRRSAFLRSSDRIFSSLEGIACISLGKFVNNRVIRRLRLQDFADFVHTTRDNRSRALSDAEFGRKARGSPKVEIVF